jgi:heterodisulfide reductase subunit A2
MSRIGVFVCWCGENIGRTVDCPAVAEAARHMPGVAYAADYKYMCSDPGQQMIIKAIAEHHLTGLVVASCSPRMHEPTFRKAAARAGLNPYLCEMANIREHCSWVHEDRSIATPKAIELVRVMVEKVRHNVALQAVSVPITDRALVIGGGIAGIQAALDIADAGHDVILVERAPSIGGHMSQLSETFPTLDCSQCILTPKMVEVSRHPRIKLLTYHEVDAISGFVGNFKVRIKKKPRYVDETLCNLCGECEKVCPQIVPDEFNMGLSFRKAVYMPFPQAIPGTYTLDAEHCLGLNPVRCGKCKDVCDKKAIDYDAKETIIEEEVGAVVVATGYDLYTMQALGEYGGEKYEDVVNGLEFERILSASGPTGG